MSAERLWLGSDGKYQIKASFVCLFHDNKVKLRKPNGVVIAIPLNLLCSEDIAFIATQPKAQPSKNTTTYNNCYVGPSFYLSGDSLATSPEQAEFTNKTSLEPLQQVATLGINRNGQHMSKDEATQMIPKRPLPYVLDQFQPQSSATQTSQFSNTINSKNLAHIPSKVTTLISCYLDFQSRLRLSSLCKRLHHIIFRPDVWKTVNFHSSYEYKVNDKYFHTLIMYLRQRGSLQKSIQHVNLDRTGITSASVLLSIKYLENIETISIEKCWSIFSYQLAKELTHLAKNFSHKYPSKISKVTLGKVLHRGTITKEDQNNLDSKSFGQDAWFMNAALNKLSNKNVYFDVVACAHCHLGAANQDFTCVACGILPLQKCITCSPRCDRCGSRSCGLDTCIDPKIKIQMARCGRCELPLALCNNEVSKKCQEARNPCNSCHRLYHVRCRTLEGAYLSNQCTNCGNVACPHCELSACASCSNQWCRKCTPKAHLGYCKCIVIQGKPGASKQMTKRNVCGTCRKMCMHCGVDHFCDRCLHLHSSKCN